MRIVSFIISTFVISFGIYAQPTDINSEGNKALTFSISGLNLGGGIGGKYWLTNESSILVRISGYQSVSERDNRVSNDNYSFIQKSTTQNVSFDLEYLRTLLQNKELISYYGLSVGVDYDDTKSKATYVSGRIDDRHYTDNFVTGSALVGIELILTKSITLSGEQRLSYFSRVNKQSGNDSDYRFSTSTSLLLLSLYF